MSHGFKPAQSSMRPFGQKARPTVKPCFCREDRRKGSRFTAARKPRRAEYLIQGRRPHDGAGWTETGAAPRLGLGPLSICPVTRVVLLCHCDRNQARQKRQALHGCRLVPRLGLPERHEDEITVRVFASSKVFPRRFSPSADSAGSCELYVLCFLSSEARGALSDFGLARLRGSDGKRRTRPLSVCLLVAARAPHSPL